MLIPNIKNCMVRAVKFGNNVNIVEPVNMYECQIGDNCFIGPFVEIQKGVTIGPKTKIQSHTFICEGVTIMSNVFVGHGVMFINDLFKNGERAYGDKTKYKSTLVDEDVLIGSNCTILPVFISKGVVIGAGSVVTKDITQKGIYFGNPAKLYRKL